jgi:hypothetical protein
MSNGRFIVAGLIVVCATLLYGAGLAVSPSNPIDSQSIFALYGAVLGFMFGIREREIKTKLGEQNSGREKSVRGQQGDGEN